MASSISCSALSFPFAANACSAAFTRPKAWNCRDRCAKFVRNGSRFVRLMVACFGLQAASWGKETPASEPSKPSGEIPCSHCQTSASSGVAAGKVAVKVSPSRPSILARGLNPNAFSRPGSQPVRVRYPSTCTPLVCQASITRCFWKFSSHSPSQVSTVSVPS